MSSNTILSAAEPGDQDRQHANGPISESVNDSNHLETLSAMSKLHKMVGGFVVLALLFSVAANVSTSNNNNRNRRIGVSRVESVVASSRDNFIFPIHRDGDRPFTCVSAENMAEMWKASSQGIVTNARLLEDNDDKAEEEERRLSFRFDGAMHNETHLCFPTQERNTVFCIDFTKDDCNTGEEGEPSNHHERRQLFQYLIADKDTQARIDAEHGASQAGGIRHGRRLCRTCAVGSGWSASTI